MVFIIWVTNLFATVHTEIGYKFYAEKVMTGPFDYPVMPFNSVINLLYLFIGFYWIYKSRMFYDENLITSDQFRFFRIFSWMSIIYGPVQLFRVLLQSHETAVLDQWCTLPFFMWVVTWCIYCKRDCNWRVGGYMMGISLFSYVMAVFHKFGFDYVLGVHIFAALMFLVILKCVHGGKRDTAELARGFFCLCGFVFFKMLDLKLVNLGFNYVSGHFFSKVCDCLQIHYVCRFFMKVIVNKNERLD